MASSRNHLHVCMTAAHYCCCQVLWGGSPTTTRAPCTPSSIPKRRRPTGPAPPAASASRPGEHRYYTPHQCTQHSVYGTESSSEPAFHLPPSCFARRVHLAVSYSSSSDTAYHYVNGSLVATSSTYPSINLKPSNYSSLGKFRLGKRSPTTYQVPPTTYSRDPVQTADHPGSPTPV